MLEQQQQQQQQLEAPQRSCRLQEVTKRTEEGKEVHWSQTKHLKPRFMVWEEILAAVNPFRRVTEKTRDTMSMCETSQTHTVGGS